MLEGGLLPSVHWKSSFEKTHVKALSFRHRILLQREEHSSRGWSQYHLDCCDACAAGYSYTERIATSQVTTNLLLQIYFDFLVV